MTTPKVEPCNIYGCMQVTDGDGNDLFISHLPDCAGDRPHDRKVEPYTAAEAKDEAGHWASLDAPRLAATLRAYAAQQMHDCERLRNEAMGCRECWAKDADNIARRERAEAALEEAVGLLECCRQMMTVDGHKLLPEAVADFLAKHKEAK